VSQLIKIENSALKPINNVKHHQSSRLLPGRTPPLSSLLALAAACFSSLAPAEIVITGRADLPVSTVSASGVPVINIVAPNSHGISHNRFEHFDVKNPGVVFNNSTEHGQSQLAGALPANPNLSTNATLILGEVTGMQPSHIEGILEVFGARADLIIANPNGLTLNGVTTLNVRGFAATTAIPNGADGLKLSVPANGNRVVINAAGVDTSGLSYFDVIARAIVLNGSIGAPHATADVQLIAGSNQYDVLNRSISKGARADQGRPEIAIDGSAAGAMYGGHIALISTEEGPGVRHAGAMHVSGDIVIRASGDIEIVKASGDVQPPQSFAQEPGLFAGGNIQLSSDESIYLHNPVSAGGDVLMKSDLYLVNASHVTAAGHIDLAAYTFQLDSGARLASLGDIRIDSKSSLHSESDSTIAASGNIELNAGTSVTTAAQIDSGGTTSVTAKGNLTNTGMIFSTGNLTMSSGQSFINEHGAILTTWEDLTLTSAGDFYNRTESMISSGGNLVIDAGKKATNDQESTLDGLQVSITADIVHNRRDSIIHGLESLNITGRLSELNTEGGMLMENNEILPRAGLLRF